MNVKLMHTLATQHDDSQCYASSQSGVTNCQSVSYLGGGKSHLVKSSILSPLSRIVAALCLMAILALSNTSCTNIEKLTDSELNAAIKAKIELFGTDFSTTSSIPIELQTGLRYGIVRIYADDPATNPKAYGLITLMMDRDGSYSGNMTIPNTLIGTTLYAVGEDYYAAATASKSITTFYSSVNNIYGRADINNTIYSEAWCQAQYEHFIDYLPEGNYKLDEYGNIVKDSNDQYVLNDILNKTKISKRENNDLELKKACKVVVAYLFSGAANYERLYYYYYPTGTTVNATYIQKFIDAGNKFNVFYENEAIRIPSNATNSTIIGNEKLPIVNNMKGQNGIINHESKELFATYECKYYGEPDNFTSTGTDIPANYSVGFVLKTVRSYNGLSTHDGNTGNDVPLIYCDNRLNTVSDFTEEGTYTTGSNCTKYSYQSSRFLSTTNDNSIIIGFEDIAKTMNVEYQYDNLKSERVKYTDEDDENNQGYHWDANYVTDWDYNDLIVAVGTYPEDALDTEEDTPIPVETEGDPIFGTLMFEDLYPKQGDYDMNDVMVKYCITPTLMGYQGTNGTYQSCIKKIDCEFYPYCDGATYANNFHFGIKLPNGLTLKVNNEEKNYIDKEIYTGNRTTINSIKAGTQDAFTYTLEFLNDGVPFLLTKDYYGSEKTIHDPFILVTDTGYEVHLTGKRATNGMLGNPNDEDDVLNDYYALNDNKNDQLLYPFAMDIPLNDRVEDHEDDGQFVPLTERDPISSVSTYMQWVSFNKDHYGENVDNDYENWYTSRIQTNYNTSNGVYIMGNW